MRPGGSARDDGPLAEEVAVVEVRDGLLGIL